VWVNLLSFLLPLIEALCRNQCKTFAVSFAEHLHSAGHTQGLPHLLCTLPPVVLWPAGAMLGSVSWAIPGGGGMDTGWPVAEICAFTSSL
jgi:hypothetical protein